MKSTELNEKSIQHPMPTGLIARCIDAGIAVSAQEVQILYDELLKYLWLGRFAYGGKPTPMFSERIDSVWHEWILFTKDYAAACFGIFGVFMHHEPVGSQRKSIEEEVANMIEFTKIYEQHFGELPAIWNINEHIINRTMPKRVCLDPVEQCEVLGRLHLSSSPLNSADYVEISGVVQPDR